MGLLWVILSWANLALGASIIGQDDRVEPYEVSSPKLRSLSHSVAALVDKSTLQRKALFYCFTDEVVTYREWAGLCPGVRFSEQLSAADCTGFLVGEDLIATAGHCLTERSCENWAVVFGYHAEPQPRWLRPRFTADEVYGCEEVVFHDEKADVAIMRLDRGVVGRVPLKLNQSKSLALGTPVAILGHPHGLPLKVSGGASVQENTHSDEVLFFEADLDAFGGNSGSPVVNASTGEVEGIYVVGFGSFDEKAHPKTGNRCQVPAQRNPGEATFGWASRIGNLNLSGTF